MPVAMLVDTTLCTGCRGCQVACKQWWDLPAEKTENRGSYENPPDLSPSTWTRVTFHEIEQDETVRWFHMAWGCVHCTDAGCVAVCPTGALRRDEQLGIVTLDRDRCNGCGYCVEACPFGVPRLEASLLTGRGKATKCNFCQDRITNDLLPACVKTCPTNAIRFGDRADMVALGKRRVDRLKQEGLAEARLYGDDELGGLGRMFVLGASASSYNLPENPEVSRSIRVWQKAMRPIGKLAIVGTVVGLAVNWFVNFRSRRNGKDAPEQTEER